MDFSSKNKSIFDCVNDTKNGSTVSINSIKSIGYNQNSDRLFIRVYRNPERPDIGCYPFGTCILSDFTSESIVKRFLGKITFSDKDEKESFSKDLTTLVKTLKNEIPKPKVK